MSAIDRYSIKVGQVYHRADGTDEDAEVTDITTFADCDDVVIKLTVGNLPLSDPRRIDAWKLARCRYYLCTDGC